MCRKYINIILIFFAKECPVLAERGSSISETLAGRARKFHLRSEAPSRGKKVGFGGDPQIGISAGAYPDPTLIPMSRLTPRLFEDIR